MCTLVTGATGFLGSHVARLLVERGEQVRLLVRASSSMRLIDEFANENVVRVTGDLRDTGSLAEAVRGVHTVYHVAADYRLWARDPREIFESNVEGTRNLLQASKLAGVSRFVYTSTVATVVGAREESRGDSTGKTPEHSILPSEDTLTSADEMIGTYKRSKWFAEQEALSSAAAGMPVVIVNPTTPVGPGDAKPTPTGRILVDFLNGRMPAYVDTGLNFVPVEDAAMGHLQAAEWGKPGERYILGGENLTLENVLALLAGISGRKAPSVRLPHVVALAAAYADAAFSRVLSREPRIPLDGVRMARHNMFVSTEKARRELGFVPGPVSEALERAVRWYEANGFVTSRHRAGVEEAHAA